MDKAFWKAVAESGYAVPEGHSPGELLPGLLTNLGSTDPELRDDLCWSTLHVWLVRGLFSPDEVRGLVGKLLENLEVGPAPGGGGETDAVFLRTFSILSLWSVLQLDAKAGLLGENEVRRVLEAALDYLAAERDLRGLVPGKGWAHGVAHTADVLAALARHPALGAADLERILEAVRAKVVAATPVRYAFAGREEFRLGAVVAAVAGRALLPLETLASWIRGFSPSPSGKPWVEAFAAEPENAACHNTWVLLAALRLIPTRGETAEPEKATLLAAVDEAMASFVLK